MNYRSLFTLAIEINDIQLIFYFKIMSNYTKRGNPIYTAFI